MIRGTTPTLVFKLDTSLDLGAMKEIWATLKSASSERTFTLSELEVNTQDSTVTLKLSQEDTLAFRGDVDCQLRFLLNNEKAYASNIQRLSLSQILKDGVIS